MCYPLELLQAEEGGAVCTIKGACKQGGDPSWVAEPEGSQASEDTVWLGKTILAIATLSVPGEHQNALIDVKPTRRGGQWHLLVGVTAPRGLWKCTTRATCVDIRTVAGENFCPEHKPSP